MKKHLSNEMIQPSEITGGMETALSEFTAVFWQILPVFPHYAKTIKTEQDQLWFFSSEIAVRE